jgi:GNAT superfamily N-acetyltransferase
MEFIDVTLARRLELAHAHRTVEYAQAQKELNPQLGASVEQIGSAFAVYAGPGSPVNGVGGMGLSGPTRRHELNQVVRFFETRETSARVTVCPLADSSLTELLAERGFCLQAFFSVLLMPMAIAHDSAAPEPAIDVREVHDEDRGLWLRTVAGGFAGEGSAQSIIEIIRPTLYSASARSFLALVRGVPAGGGTIISHEGVAELCSASTLPAFRGRGVHTALIHARLIAARQAGCDLAMVITAPAAPSQRNVERLGFRLAYTRAVVTTR